MKQCHVPYEGKRFHVTYEIVTPESAENADADERGFVLPYDHVVMPNNVCGPKAGEIKAACAVTLRQALRLVGLCDNSGFWFTEIDGRLDVHTGGHETRSLHCPDDITPASYRRIGRLVGVR